MKKIHAFAAAAITLAVPAAAMSSASAAPAEKAQAQVLGPVVTHDDGTASLTARYTCPEGFHLWVSAKQVADGQPDARLQSPESSQYAAAWLQSHPAPDAFTCDGDWHTDTFQIDTFEQGFGEFQQGQAWVQFCLIGERTFISESRWTAVV